MIFRALPSTINKPLINRLKFFLLPRQLDQKHAKVEDLGLRPIIQSTLEWKTPLEIFGSVDRKMQKWVS